MNKKIISIFSLVALITLSGCNKGNDNSSKVNSHSSTETNPSDITKDTYEVRVLLPNGQSAGEGITVQWCANGTCYDASTNAQGLAYKNLDAGDYDVKLFGFDAKYTYQLGQVATSENRKIDIKLLDILTAYASDTGVEAPEAGSAYNPYEVKEGAYNVTIKNEEDVQYFGFIPNRPGKYVIESLGTSLNLITANPYVNYYGNNPQYVNEVLLSDDDGGYDVNFALELNIPIQEFTTTGELDANGDYIYSKDNQGNYVAGGLYIFGISATPVKSPKTFPFIVKWVEDYVLTREHAEVISVQEKLSQFPEKNPEYIWIDSKINGVDTVVYNEEDGFYHVDTKDGYVLTAKISTPCNYLDRPFTKVVEDAEGNKSNEGIVGLTGIVLDNGKKDYTTFIQEYEKYCNSDGVYGVTEELKTFLDLYFKNSKDWITSLSQTVVEDEAGWLFACGYYADVKDSFAKPWSGDGTSENAYSLEMGNLYYADVKSDSSVYYSYFIKGNQEITVYISSANTNAKIIYNGNEYYSETGAYVEVNMGGMTNPGLIIFEISTVNGEEEGIVFEIGLKEKTVAGDAIALGDNTIEVLKGQSVACSFVAPRDGTYVITSSEANAWFRYNSVHYKGSEGSISFSADLKKGDTLSFTLLTCNLEKDYITFKISCDVFLEEDINLLSIGKDEIVEYIFIAKVAGTYRFECSTDNTMMIYKEGNVESIYFGDTEDNSFTLNLKENQEIVIKVTTYDRQADTAIITINRI